MVTKQKYLIRLFTGRVRLGETFWVYGVLIGGLGLGLIDRLLGRNMDVLSQSLWGLGLGYAFFALANIYILLVAVAIWRSAGRYSGPGIWAWAARLAVVAAGVQFLMEV